MDDHGHITGTVGIRAANATIKMNYEEHRVTVPGCTFVTSDRYEGITLANDGTLSINTTTASPTTGGVSFTITATTPTNPYSEDFKFTITMTQGSPDKLNWYQDYNMPTPRLDLTWFHKGRREDLGYKSDDAFNLPKWSSSQTVDLTKYVFLNKEGRGETPFPTPEPTGAHGKLTWFIHPKTTVTKTAITKQQQPPFSQSIDQTVFNLTPEGIVTISALPTLGVFYFYVVNQWGYPSINLKGIYSTYSPADIFQYQFVDQEFGKKFATEELIGSLTNIFAGLAIFICCIGLAGLASFTIEKRFREIGVRKVLGATVQQLLMLIATEFLKLVLIAFVIAVPLTWWLMFKWLENYAYHVSISIWLFGGVGVVILLLTMAVVSLNTLRAATTNPVKSLRSE